jgi:hypothetical protein
VIKAKRGKMSILSPQFLLNHINIVGEIISVMLLVLFDDFFTQRVAFRGADGLKSKLLEKSKEKFKKRHRILIKYAFEFLTTIIFIAYFFIGYWILSEYVVVPVLVRTQGILLLTIIIFFLVFSWVLNDRKARRKFLGYY